MNFEMDLKWKLWELRDAFGGHRRINVKVYFEMVLAALGHRFHANPLEINFLYT